jgi:pimeloyl-ACP methyl ester carboxylesterase
LLGGLGRVLVHVLTFPVSGIAGRLASRVIRDWEGGARPAQIRPVTPDDYAAHFVGEMTSDDWVRLAGGRCLLWVHGTFSQTESGFGAIGRNTMAALHAAYQGRMFGYDHPTVGFSPAENVDRLVALVRAGLRSQPVDALDVDIVCHSRGGLVSRLLAERAPVDQPLRVGKVVFVASPNAGTQLCDGRHMSQLIDRYTNLLSIVPNPVSDAFQALIELLKTLTVSTVDRLPGLHAMCPAPDGDFLADLNKSPRVTARYYALGANYEPQPGIRELTWGRDGMMDQVFRRDTVHGLEAVANDLVVPTASVWDLGNGGSFPFVQRESWGPDRSIDHSGFFRDPASMDLVTTWLTED